MLTNQQSHYLTLTVLNLIMTKQLLTLGHVKNIFKIFLLINLILPLLAWSEQTESTQNLLYRKTSQVQVSPKNWKSFAEHVQTVRHQLEKFHASNNFSAQRVAMNSPIELIAPKTCPQPVDGVLLIHGLNTSPYSMMQVAKDLNQQCFTVYSPLLSGHGTAPADLAHIKLERWESSINHFVKLLKTEAQNVYLGGVSLGGALAISHALSNPDDVAGLIVFDAALSISSLATFGPIIRIFKPWWSERPELNFIKYQSLLSNAAYQVHRITKKIQKSLKHEKLIPKILAYFTLPDSTIEAPKSIEILAKLSDPKRRKIVIRTAFSHRQQALKLKQKAQDIVILPAKSELYKAISLAHGAATMPPEDSYLGQGGSYKDCMHYHHSARYQECLQKDAITVYAETHKDNISQPKLLFRRTTFNPFYKQMMQELLEFIKQK